MGIKKYKPTSPARRFASRTVNTELTKKKREKSLVVSLKKSGGRNNEGKITVRHRGGGSKRLYRIIDFKRDKWGMSAQVKAIEYDPNRSCRIALVTYSDGEKRYMLHPVGLSVGDTVFSGSGVEIKVGNALPLKEIPVGTAIHNIEMKQGRGGQLVRGAGTSAQIVSKEEKYAQIKMPSGEIRRIFLDCVATVGRVGNVDNEKISFGGAGRVRRLGRRPKVRGTAMNTCDHPHGGGRGKSKGRKHPVSPWGQPAKGYKTRKKKYSDKMIVKRKKSRKQR